MADASDWESVDEGDEFETDIPMYVDDERQGRWTLQHADFKYTVYRPDQVIAYMNKVIDEVHEVLGLTRSVVRILLQHFRWDKEKLLERFFESDSGQILCEANITSDECELLELGESTSDDSVKVKDAEDNAFCGICFGSYPLEETTHLQCKHRFCKGCWDSYLRNEILNEGKSDKIRCPGQECLILVDEAKVRSLVRDKQVLMRYQKLMTLSFVECNKLFRWCSRPSCLNAVGVSYSAPLPVRCSCGFNFCFQCGKEWHEPIQCNLLIMWLTKCDDDSESANWLAANTKDCPGCHFPIEKRGGCNHMTCKNVSCGFEFCWVCLGPWKPHGVEWYKCNRFNEEESLKAQSTQEKSRAALVRYLHYFNRYNNHLHSLKLEHKLHHAVQAKMDELQRFGMSWIEVQFLRIAVEILLRCRQTLMYTYAFAFYLRKNNQCEVFEQNQADLERATEELSYFLERESGSTPAGVLKQRIQDKYSYCENRRKVLVDHVYEGYDNEYWEYRTEIMNQSISSSFASR